MASYVSADCHGLEVIVRTYEVEMDLWLSKLRPELLALQLLLLLLETKLCSPKSEIMGFMSEFKRMFVGLILPCTYFLS
uniref:Uncharacterized protein n=1 Tax=Manihot esculenta TaxID=3983 RepID=A0A2C9VLQ2_MANES